MDKLTPEQRKRNMRANSATGTSIEIMLGRKLWSLGYRYRKNVRTIAGTTKAIMEVVLTKALVASIALPESHTSVINMLTLPANSIV